MHRFSDFAQEDRPLEGDKLQIDDILNQEISILDYKVNKSKFSKGSGKCTTIQIESNNVKNVIFTGS